MLALAVLVLAGCSDRLGEFRRALAAQDSATAALGQWCETRRIARPATIRAERITDALAPSAEVRGLLQAGAQDAIGYRHVRLSCGGTVLSVAHNWYLPARLTPAMNRALDTSDTPFGRVVAPLGFTRRRLEEVRGAVTGCPRGTILAHRGLLVGPDGAPFSLVIECYTRANLARR